MKKLDNCSLPKITFPCTTHHTWCGGKKVVSNWPVVVSERSVVACAWLVLDKEWSVGGQCVVGVGQCMVIEWSVVVTCWSVSGQWSSGGGLCVVSDGQ